MIVLFYFFTIIIIDSFLFSSIGFNLTKCKSKRTNWDLNVLLWLDPFPLELSIIKFQQQYYFLTAIDHYVLIFSANKACRLIPELFLKTRIDLQADFCVQICRIQYLTKDWTGFYYSLGPHLIYFKNKNKNFLKWEIIFNSVWVYFIFFKFVHYKVQFLFKGSEVLLLI